MNEHATAEEPHICAGKSPVSENLLFNGRTTPLSRKTYGDSFQIRSTPSPSFINDTKEQEEDAESLTSGAPSVHSYLDDVPRTPKRPLSYLDPRNPSLVTEVLYVSIGLAVISLGAFMLYRIIRQRR